VQERGQPWTGAGPWLAAWRGVGRSGSSERTCLPAASHSRRPENLSVALPSSLLPIGSEPVDHVPFDGTAIIEVHPPDRAPLIRFGDAAGDGPDPQRAAAEAPRPVRVSVQLLQLHPVSRSIGRDPGDLLSAIVRRFLAYYLQPPLLISGVQVFRCSGIQVFRCEKGVTALDLADPEHLNTGTPEHPFVVAIAGWVRAFSLCSTTPRRRHPRGAVTHRETRRRRGSRSHRDDPLNGQPVSSRTPPATIRSRCQAGHRRDERTENPSRWDGSMGALWCGSRACASRLSSPWNR
jgi:hypothetical protein